MSDTIDAHVTVDAHVGQGDVPLTIEITYEVNHPNATDFKAVTEGALETLPVVP